MKSFQIVKSLIYIFVSILVCLNQSTAQTSFSRNLPDLKWHTFETTHFQIIYHQGIEIIAHETAKIAEQVYPVITLDLGAEPPVKTPIIVTDYLDYSNGLATPLGHYIFLWTQNYHKYTTGDTNWLQTLIAHEFTHIVNFWAFRKFPGFWWELTGLGFVPTWFLEGVAEYEAEKWCTHRDMLLRVTAYHKQMLPYKKMTGYIGADQIDARLVYEQGHSLIRYIAARFGHDAVKKIILKFRAFPFSFNLALKRGIGISEKQLFAEWKEQIDSHYTQEYNKHQPLNETAQIFKTPFQGNYGARWSPAGDKIAVVAINEYDEHVRELYIYSQESGKFKKVAGPYVNSFFSWSPDGKKIIYSQKHLVSNGASINDLFSYDIIGKKIKRITTNERATDPHSSPDGKRVVYAVHQISHSNLAILDLTSEEKKVITDFPQWTEVFTPVWSPAGDKIVFSIFDNQGNRDICLINSDGSNIERLTNDPADDRYPTWSPDGENIAFISYRTGIPNLFVMNLSTRQVRQITDTPGGVFNPTWLPDGKQIAVITFEKRDNTDIIILPFSESDSKQKENSTTSSLKFHHQHEPVFLQESTPLFKSSTDLYLKKYNSLLNTRSQILLPYAGRDETGYQPGILNLFSDPLGKHTLMTTMSYRSRFHYSIDYTNRQFSPTIRFYLQKTTLDHGDFLQINQETTLKLVENYWSGSVLFLWNLNFGKSILSNHLLWTRFNFTYRNSINYNEYETNNIPQWARPFQGWSNFLTFGYSWETYRPDISFDIHPKTGYYFGVFGYWGDPAFYSDLTYKQINMYGIARRELFLKEHVVAARLGTVFRTGDQPSQSLLGIGSQTLRGLNFSRTGDKQIFANLEYRFPLIRDLRLKLWILYFERFTGALFFDTGKAWGTNWHTFYDGSKTSFSNVDWAQTTGGELRHRLYLLGKIPVVIRAGYGFNLSDLNEANYYVLFGPVF